MYFTRRRYTNADFWNIPTGAMKLKRKRHGTLRMYFDEKGELMHAYSYNTCIFTRLPNGRAVVNKTKYSNTTLKHQYSLQYYWDARSCDTIEAPVNVTSEQLAEWVTRYMSYSEDYTVSETDALVDATR